MMFWLLRAVSRGVPAADLPAGVNLRAASWLTAVAGRLSGMRAPAAAVTLGRTIIVDPNVQLTDRLLRHELAHVQQWRRYPLTFPMRYAINHLRYGYYANPFEVEARAAELPGGKT